MKSMRVPILLLLAAVASHATAGVKYNYITTMESSRFSEKASGTVWVEGQSYRAEVTRADGSRHGIVSRDGDRTATLINFQQNTTHPRVRARGNVVSSALFAFPVGNADVKGFPQVQYSRGGTKIVAGERAVGHTIAASFRVEGAHKVGGDYTVVARIWTSDALPPLPMRSEVRTGFQSVDALIDEASAKITGMVLRHELEITRTLDGGPAQVERTTTTITRLQKTDVPAEQFVTP